MISARRRMFLLLVLFVTLGLAAPLLHGASPVRAAADLTGQIKLMSQNQYLGAELMPMVRATTEAAQQKALRAMLNQIKANRFDKRAKALARQIKDIRPDVVSLQQVWNIQRDGKNGAAPYRDHLADTLAALGDTYQVAAQGENMTAKLPADLNGDGRRDAQIGLTDRNVILVRKGVPFTPAPFRTACPRPDRRGGPGCNYQVGITVTTPLGAFAIDRGLTSIDLSVNGRDYRVINTHLERPDIEPGNPRTTQLQSMQADELVQLLRVTEPVNRAVIVLGDLQSREQDEPVIVHPQLIVPPYHKLIGEELFDVWKLQQNPPAGNTCCFKSDLRLPFSKLDRRTNHLFSSTEPTERNLDVVGDAFGEWARAGAIWPSDHGTLTARLRYP